MRHPWTACSFVAAPKNLGLQFVGPKQWRLVLQVRVLLLEFLLGRGAGVGLSSVVRDNHWMYVWMVKCMQ